MTVLFFLGYCIQISQLTLYPAKKQHFLKYYKTVDGAAEASLMYTHNRHCIAAVIHQLNMTFTLRGTYVSLNL